MNAVQVSASFLWVVLRMRNLGFSVDLHLAPSIDGRIGKILIREKGRDDACSIPRPPEREVSRVVPRPKPHIKPSAGVKLA